MKKSLVGRRWEDNIRMDLREVGWEGADWMHLAQVRDQWRVLSIKGGEFLDYLSDSASEERPCSMELLHPSIIFV
jgi:hypothetical protein